MEFESATLMTKLSNDGISEKSAYGDGILATPPIKLRAPIFSPRFDDEDYCEIFISSSGASTIPILELPELKDNERRMMDDVIDYSEVFNGFESNLQDVTVILEKLDVVVKPKAKDRPSARNRLLTENVETWVCSPNWVHAFDDDGGDNDNYNENEIWEKTFSKSASNVLDVKD